jgi:hypothetical protein
MSELLCEIFSFAISHLLICAVDIELLLKNFDVINILIILECCITERKGSDYRVLGLKKLYRPFKNDETNMSISWFSERKNQ